MPARQDVDKTGLVLEVERLAFSYGGEPFFSGLDFQLKPSEHAVIVGGSGSGKSTLIRLLAESKMPEISYKDSAKPTMVLQEGALLDHVSVLGNLQVVARHHRPNVSAHQISQVLEDLDIGAGLHRMSVGQLSGGQARRVAIARALLTHPQVMIFDEPDAGLDVVNLNNLAAVVNQLTTQGTACITVSHNPLYIARIATHVYRLVDGQLKLLKRWSIPADSDKVIRTRQTQLIDALGEAGKSVNTHNTAPRFRFKPLLIDWCKGLYELSRNLVQAPRSFTDSLRTLFYGTHLGFISGSLFFAMVGTMLGATTLAVVKLLADSSLTGIVSWFISPEKLVDLMGGRFALYLAPAIGAMLFVARSGSLTANWLGEIVRSKQLQALKLLDVPTHAYLINPMLIAMFVSSVATITLFAAAIWVGGVFAATQFFALIDPVSALQINQADIQQSEFIFKTLIYSTIITFTTTAFAIIQKRTSKDVNRHTTSAIVYSTMLVALAELLILLY
ncbi:MAG: ATP-binding cassette domain-containing protein [Pseudomonadota bacterium]